MTKKEKHLLLFKSFFLLAICVCLTIGLYTQTVKGNTAYVTSLSVTCVNTFTGESQTEPSQPTEPSESEPNVPSKPPTGDSNQIGWYLAAMLLGASGIVGGLMWTRKKDSHNCFK